MARPSGPVTGSSRDVVSSGSNSFTGTSSGTSALRVPPEGRTRVTGTSDIFDSFLIWDEQTTICKPVCATRGTIYFELGATHLGKTDDQRENLEGSPLRYIMLFI